MTRDQVRNIISGITDEQLQQILDINSADIGKAKEPIAAHNVIIVSHILT